MNTPRCPYCQSPEAYRITTRNIFKCKKSLRQISEKSSGKHRSSKLPLKNLQAIEKEVTADGPINIAAFARKHGLSYHGAWQLVKRIRAKNNSNYHPDALARRL